MQNEQNINPEPGNRANVVLNAVLSVFDGMSCGQLALQRAGIEYKEYYASEIDKHAISVTQHNFPNTKQLGSITELKTENLPIIDLFIGGSPCQSFSSFGNGKGFDGKSGLFWEYVRVLKELKLKNPNIKFILENVNMKKEWCDIISNELGVEPIAFNSNLVSAQNRDRLYWTNINFIVPRDKNILFNDILENLPFREIPKCFYKNWGDKMRIDKGLNWVKNKKANCLTTKNCHTNQYLLNEDKSLCRLLTANEFEKLQTVPLNYTNIVSNTERFKMLGNGWTVDVIAHIFNGLH
jgi:site-specific DNA-cytosine methylase